MTWDDVARAITAAYAVRYDLEPAEPDEETLELARSLAPGHLSPAA